MPSPTPARGAASPPGAASWREVLDPLLKHAPEVPAEDPRPLAIGFDLRAQAFEKSRYSWNGDEEATLAHLEEGQRLTLAMRPLKAGRRTGSWVKSGISWRSFEYRLGHEDFVREHAEALHNIFALALAHRSYTLGRVDQLWLNDLSSDLMWEMLRRARDAGVELVGQGTVAGIDIGERAELRLDAALATDGAPGSGGLIIRPVAAIDGVDASLSRLIGSGAVADIAAETSDRLHLRLAPTAAPVPRSLQELIARGEPLRIPAPDVEEFWRGAYPTLQHIVPLTSTDGTVELPEVEKPTLILQAAYAEEERLDLHWSWQYHDPERTLPLHLSSRRDEARARREKRDIDHEDAVIAEVRTLWPTVGGVTGSEHLSDVDTAVFTTETLDALARLPFVEVHITGTRHRFRELDGAPQIRVRQTPSTKNDWFDLGFEILVGEEPVAFSSVFLALAQGRSKVLLPNRRDYVDLTGPAFDELRRLIAEGEALAEWNPEQQQISRYQVEFWNEIVAAADEARAAREWEETVGRLADLTALPTQPLPIGLHAELRPYQLEGYRWLAFLHEYRLGGILADDMGLGKTLQTLALIARAREVEPSAPPFLVVAPSSVLSVWKSEAERFTPGLDVRLVDRTRRAHGVDVEGADVIVTSYALLRIDETEVTGREWSGLILDEAQFVKNPRAKVHKVAAKVRAPFRLAITGTPMENTLADLWALLSLTATGLFPSPVAFRTEYTQPIESGEAPHRMERLRARIRPFVLRRTKELVASDLPAKQEQVLRVALEPEHRELYDMVLQRERKKVLGLLDDMDRHRMIVFRSLTLLRMLALDPAIIDDGAYEDVPGSKSAVLLDHLREAVADGHRVLVFSQFTSYLRRVVGQLRSEGLDVAYLDGSTRGRAQVIEEWREGEAPVFLISLKAGGFGLTLTEADYVFLLDPWWNPAAESQAIDRAHRIGQDKQVMVYRMVSEDTIEEKVLALQRKKAELFTALTDDGAAFSDAITAEDVRGLLEG